MSSCCHVSAKSCLHAATSFLVCDLYFVYTGAFFLLLSKFLYACIELHSEFIANFTLRRTYLKILVNRSYGSIENPAILARNSGKVMLRLELGL